MNEDKDWAYKLRLIDALAPIVNAHKQPNNKLAEVAENKVIEILNSIKVG